jgi:NitT/TauT family transport system substrate-binding protein
VARFSRRAGVEYSGKTFPSRIGVALGRCPNIAAEGLKEIFMQVRVSTSAIPRRTLLAGAGALLGLALPAGRRALAAEAVTYLFPAPPILPAFGPIQLAKGKGYFAAAGLDVSFAVGRGGVDVAKQVGAGNAPIGGIVADGPIMVRQNGVPIKIVAVFGGKGFMQLVVREDSGITKPADLKGKTITVMSYQDTTFYALLGLLASVGLTQDDLDIQSAGPTGVWELVAAGKSAGMAGVPDWIPPVQAAGVKVRIIPSDEYFPHMAQGIGVSDQTIKEKPDLVRAVVKAALHGMKDIMDDPDKAAEDFVRFVPEWRGKEGAVKATFAYYDTFVYPGQNVLGEVNPERLAKLQDFYLLKGLIQRKSPIDDLYTNAFIK